MYEYTNFINKSTIMLIDDNYLYKYEHNIERDKDNYLLTQKSIGTTIM
jgi:hypothetical protein